MLYEWKEVFIIAALVHICGVTFYGLFASGEEQEWAKGNNEEMNLLDEDAGIDDVNTNMDFDSTNNRSNYGTVS